ncbi:MAG: GNAT family N-acetyltransferase [Rhodospirillales bacterium]|jgi:GNAT superfamily N-acetyltransferase|nr:GNAT family N-acetyltransferase [Rhodospirillales bacterium]MDP6773937.1 GNAT family N-acetyltransferase [Rhodospirillales bacterium]
MIRTCGAADFEAIHDVINDAAEVYRNAIPADCWHEPYMAKDELRREMEAGVGFLGFVEDGALTGIMGLQDVQDVALIRHAYVLTSAQRQGIGGRLLTELLQAVERPVLVGTWAAATWAVRFYGKHGFTLVTPREKDRLLRKYWSIPDRQIETSVVLADAAWRDRRPA